MLNLWRDFQKYIRAIFSETKGHFYAVFNVLGILGFLFPRFFASPAVESNTRLIGGVIALVSFLLANFTLYQKIACGSTLDSEPLLINRFPYRNHSSNAIELKYIGSEVCRDLSVSQIYTDKTGNVQKEKIDKFFPGSDHDLMWKVFSVNSMSEGDIVRFPTKSSGKIIVEVGFIGTKTGKKWGWKKEVDLG